MSPKAKAKAVARRKTSAKKSCVRPRSDREQGGGPDEGSPEGAARAQRPAAARDGPPLRSREDAAEGGGSGHLRGRLADPARTSAIPATWSAAGCRARRSPRREAMRSGACTCRPARRSAPRAESSSHPGLLSLLLRSYIESDYEEDPGFRPGDIFENNDPHFGGIHSADFQTTVPIFYQRQADRLDRLGDPRHGRRLRAPGIDRVHEPGLLLGRRSGRRRADRRERPLLSLVREAHAFPHPRPRLDDGGRARAPRGMPHDPRPR